MNISRSKNTEEIRLTLYTNIFCAKHNVNCSFSKAKKNK